MRKLQEEFKIEEKKSDDFNYFIAEKLFKYFFPRETIFLAK
jgi:hypothetical protein